MCNVEGDFDIHCIDELVQKPVRRLWLQSMTPEAIREGFGALRSGA